MRERKQELRRAKRVPKRQGAWITPAANGIRVPCTIWDISEGGARLAAPRPRTLPANFILLLSHDGNTRRFCSIVWRSETQVGVQFVEEHEMDVDVPRIRTPLRQAVPAARRELSLGRGGPVVTKPPAHKPAGPKPPAPHAPVAPLPGMPASRIAPRPAEKPSTAPALFGLLVVVGLAGLIFRKSFQGFSWAPLCGNANIFCGHPELPAAAAVLLVLVLMVIRRMKPD